MCLPFDADINKWGLRQDKREPIQISWLDYLRKGFQNIINFTSSTHSGRYRKTKRKYLKISARNQISDCGKHCHSHTFCTSWIFTEELKVRRQALEMRRYITILYIFCFTNTVKRDKYGLEDLITSVKKWTLKVYR